MVIVNMNYVDVATNTTYKFTVFTATYNRRATLHRVYQSLVNQTYRDFEWLIVDDGSADGTRETVEEWIAEDKLSVRYYWQENQGKHLAFNYGVTLARGQLFLTLDSDDGCVPDALEKLINAWNAIPDFDREKYSAVTALCMDENGVLVGSRFPKDVLDSDSLELRYRYKVQGEKWGFHRTEVLKIYPFPFIQNSKFIPEGIVWSAIAKKYKTRYINELLRIYYRNENTNSQQRLTNTEEPGKHAISLAYWHNSILNNDMAWFLYNPAAFLKSSIHYFRFAFHQKLSIINAIDKLNVPAVKLLCVLLLPVSWYVYRMDLRRNKK